MTLNTEQQADLCRALTDEDVRQNLFGIEDNKAPGADGYSSFFFKKSFHCVGLKVIEVVLGFFVLEEF